MKVRHQVRHQSEAAERHYARAKDLEQLNEAVEAKLSEQRDFVLWWDMQEKSPGGRPTENPSHQNDGFVTIDSLGMDRDTVYRWRSRLKDDARYEAALADAQERCVSRAPSRGPFLLNVAQRGLTGHKPFRVCWMRTTE